MNKKIRCPICKRYSDPPVSRGCVSCRANGLDKFLSSDELELLQKLRK